MPEIRVYTCCEQADFGKKAQQHLQQQQAKTATSQPRRAEFLPPDWLVASKQGGGKTYMGPQGQRVT